MARDSEPVECGYFEVKRDTEAALLVVDADGGEYWIPKSQICDESELCAESEATCEGELTLPEWLAIEKGLA